MKHRNAIVILTVLALLLTVCGSAGALEKPLTQCQSDLAADGTLSAGCAESKLGSLAADAALEAAGADLALLPADIVADTLEQGAVFESDLARVIPEDAPLVTAQLSPAELAALLEQGVAQLSRNESEQIDPASAWDGFPQVSGIQWEYDVSAPTGERLQYIRFQDEELDLTDTQTTLTVVSVPAFLDGSLGYPVYPFTDTGTTLRQALRDYCAARDSISAPASRSTAIGSSSYPIMDKFPVLAIVGACIVIALLASIPKWKQERFFSFKK